MDEKIEDEEWLLNMLNALSAPPMGVVLQHLRETRANLVERLIIDHKDFVPAEKMSMLVGRIDMIDDFLFMEDEIRLKLEAGKLDGEGSEDDDCGLTEEEKQRIVRGSV